MSAELSLAEAETPGTEDFWSYFNESVCDIPELENITGNENLLIILSTLQERRRYFTTNERRKTFKNTSSAAKPIRCISRF